MPFSPLQQLCDCGHDIDTHFAETIVLPGGAPSTKHGACLGMRCDCTCYRKPGERDPEKKIKRPGHASHCQCLACKEWRNAPESARE